jgi:hypothetical protein
MANPGVPRAKAIASPVAGPLTIRLALVSSPSWWARRTAALMLLEAPKSSALKISCRMVWDAGRWRLFR